MRSPIARALAFVLAASFAVPPSARAADPLPPMKRLGRGVGDRRTGAKVQLACVGEKKGFTGERGCELLQFLHTDAGGRESLVGPVLDIRYPKRRADRELRDELRCYGLFKHVAAGRFFLFSGALMGDIGKKRRERCYNPIYSTLSPTEAQAEFAEKRARRKRTGRVLGTSLGLGSWAAVGALTAMALIPEGVAMLWGIEVYGAAFVLDGAIYPFRLLFRSGKGPLGVRGKNVEALESRAKIAWQLKPKKLSHRRFEKLVARLKLLDGRGPKTDFSAPASGPTAGLEILPLVDDAVEGAAGAIAIDSTPLSRPHEWREVRSEADLVPADLEMDDV